MVGLRCWKSTDRMIPQEEKLLFINICPVRPLVLVPTWSNGKGTVKNHSRPSCTSRKDREQCIWLKEGHRWEPNWSAVSALLQIVPSALLVSTPMWVQQMDTISADFYTFLPIYSHQLSAEFVHEPSVCDKCRLQVSGCFRRSWVWNLVSAPSVCTTASVGFIRALLFFPQSKDSDISLNGLWKPHVSSKCCVSLSCNGELVYFFFSLKSVGFQNPQGLLSKDIQYVSGKTHT